MRMQAFLFIPPADALKHVSTAIYEKTASKHTGFSLYIERIQAMFFTGISGI